jgi:hypothetical protein
MTPTPLLTDAEALMCALLACATLAAWLKVFRWWGTVGRDAAATARRSRSS